MGINLPLKLTLSANSPDKYYCDMRTGATLLAAQVRSMPTNPSANNMSLPSSPKGMLPYF